jgi:hypothetical protein
VWNTDASLIKPAKFEQGTTASQLSRSHRRLGNRRFSQRSSLSLMPLEILNRAFVFLRPSLAVERAEIFPFARSRIFPAGIQPILAGFQFPNHNDSLDASVTATPILRRMQRAR